MFSVHCPDHGAEVLLPESHIVGLHDGADGIVVRWRCWCGAVGDLHTGRSRRPAEAAGILAAV